MAPSADSPRWWSLRRAAVRHHAWLLTAFLALACLAGASSIALAVRLPSSDEFNVVRWELRHAPNKWLYLSGRFLRGGLSPDEQDQRLTRYVRLSAQLQDAELGLADEPRAARLSRLTRERDALENDAEAAIEGRLTAVLEEAGLASSLPLFPQARWVFPPVDIEFDVPPRVLAISPRERIDLVARRSLRPGLPLQQAIEAEEAAERDGRHAALAIGISGAATYPSIVAPQAGYQALVETAAHEWAHQYLAFKPLGRRVLASVELRTLNETVADLAGRELAALAVRRYPLPNAREPAPAPSVDVDAVLRQLRLDVDGLLSAGEVDAAERLMEQRRQELATQGIVYRRINQAFFAFRGLYADEPASIDPLGQQLEALLVRSGSVGAFLRAASRLTSRAALERLLAAPQD